MRQEGLPVQQGLATDCGKNLVAAAGQTLHAGCTVQPVAIRSSRQPYISCVHCALVHHPVRWCTRNYSLGKTALSVHSLTKRGQNLQESFYTLPHFKVQGWIWCNGDGSTHTGTVYSSGFRFLWTVFWVWNCVKANLQDKTLWMNMSWT